jgi:hypothetical protein
LCNRSVRFRWRVRHRFASKERKGGSNLLYFFWSLDFLSGSLFRHGQDRFPQALYRVEQHALPHAADRVLAEDIAQRKRVITHETEPGTKRCKASTRTFCASQGYVPRDEAMVCALQGDPRGRRLRTWCIAYMKTPDHSQASALHSARRVHAQSRCKRQAKCRSQLPHVHQTRRQDLEPSKSRL